MRRGQASRWFSGGSVQSSAWPAMSSRGGMPFELVSVVLAPLICRLGSTSHVLATCCGTVASIQACCVPPCIATAAHVLADDHRLHPAAAGAALRSDSHAGPAAAGVRPTLAAAGPPAVGGQRGAPAPLWPGSLLPNLYYRSALACETRLPLCNKARLRPAQTHSLPRGLLEGI